MKAGVPKTASSKSSQRGSSRILERSLDTREAARILNVCTKVVAKLCDDGELAHHWIGSKRLIRPEDIEEFWRRKRIDRSKPTGVDSSNPKEERRSFLRQGSGAGQVTLEEIRSLCRQ